VDSAGVYQSGKFGLQLEGLELGNIQTISGGGVTAEIVAEAAALPPDIQAGKVVQSVSVNLSVLRGRIDLSNVRVMEIRPSQNGHRVPSRLRLRILFDVILQFESFRAWPSGSPDLAHWLQMLRVSVPQT
jgi:hypothetical protein